MKLIHFQGLNCYHDCLITLANTFGLDYTSAFSRLWSEGHLRYDPICDVFLSRRIEKTLECLGMKLGRPSTAVREREKEWLDIQAGHYAIIGMDAGLIPWSPLYRLLHGPHYFIIQKGFSEFHDCFDPTYGFSGQKLPEQELIYQSFALITIKADSAPISNTDNTHDPLLSQAQEVLEMHPETLRRFFKQAAVWMQGTETTALFPAKYVDALLTGRYLYKYYLKEHICDEKEATLFFSGKYYAEWLSVKHGFYKAALKKQNNDTFRESCRLLTSLYEQELELAGQLSLARSAPCREARPRN